MLYLYGKTNFLYFLGNFCFTSNTRKIIEQIGKWNFQQKWIVFLHVVKTQSIQPKHILNHTLYLTLLRHNSATYSEAFLACYKLYYFHKFRNSVPGVFYNSNAYPKSVTLYLVSPFTRTINPFFAVFCYSNIILNPILWFRCFLLLQHNPESCFILCDVKTLPSWIFGYQVLFFISLKSIENIRFFDNKQVLRTVGWKKNNL